MTTEQAAFAEGARWYRMGTHVEGWVFFPATGKLFTGIVFHSGIGWLAHTSRPEQVRHDVAFVDAVAIVEQAATNALDEASATPKL